MSNIYTELNIMPKKSTVVPSTSTSSSTKNSLRPPEVLVEQKKLLQDKIKGMPLALLTYRTKMIQSTSVVNKVANLTQDLMSMVSSIDKSQGSLDKQKLLELAASIPKTLNIMMRLAEEKPNMSARAQVNLVETMREYREQYSMHLEAFKDICWPVFDQVNKFGIEDDIKRYQKTFDRVGDYLLDTVYAHSIELFPDKESRNFKTSSKKSHSNAQNQEQEHVNSNDRANMSSITSARSTSSTQSTASTRSTTTIDSMIDSRQYSSKPTRRAPQRQAQGLDAKAFDSSPNNKSSSKKPSGKIHPV